VAIISDAGETSGIHYLQNHLASAEPDYFLATAYVEFIYTLQRQTAQALSSKNRRRTADRALVLSAERIG